MQAYEDNNGVVLRMTRDEAEGLTAALVEAAGTYNRYSLEAERAHRAVASETCGRTAGRLRDASKALAPVLVHRSEVNRRLVSRAEAQAFADRVLGED